MLKELSRVPWQARCSNTPLSANKLTNNGTYFSRTGGKRTLVGHGTHTMPPIQTQKFTCSGTTCKF